MRSIIQLCASKDFYFNNTGTKPFKVISSVAKIDLLLTKNIFVKDGTRCCIDHFDEIGHILDKDASNIVVVHQNVSLTGQDILEFIASFRHRETQQSTLFNRFREINTFTDLYLPFRKANLWMLFACSWFNILFELRKASRRSNQSSWKISE